MDAIRRDAMDIYRLALQAFAFGALSGCGIGFLLGRLRRETTPPRS